jgi:hypothetical protein
MYLARRLLLDALESAASARRLRPPPLVGRVCKLQLLHCSA